MYVPFNPSVDKDFASMQLYISLQKVVPVHTR